MELKNVSRYYPDNMEYGDGIQYFKSEDGQDFYDSIELFTEKYKLCIEPDTKIVRSIAEDVSTLYPVGFDVVETDALPEGVNIYGDYQFNSGKVIERSQSHAELVSEAETEKSQRLDEAATAIAPLQDAVDLGIATDEEAELLLDWKRYRVEVNRIDTNLAPDITWPVPPVSKVRF
ncbi:tail fiber assembly protein [Dryocola clanedunensis]|uniref:tail fiber assembly protein n=1 Tax=Cedecea sulfonylureivorans TaxID=3051154 RepID=UPI0019267FBF|nr:tail fiber assembly protein [Cedecea sulfonylureivorans]